MKEIKLQQAILYRRKHLSDKLIKPQTSNVKLEQIQRDLQRVEEKLDTLTKKLEKHINFIDKTYDGLKNPIEGVKKFLSR